MTTTQTIKIADFLALLSASGRSPEIPGTANAYGWLVGSWDLDVLRYLAVDLRARNIKGEAHFGWVLEGRAIQDVWIMQAPSDRSEVSDRTNNMYGTLATHRLGVNPFVETN